MTSDAVSHREHASAEVTTGADHRPLIEVGIVVAGSLDPIDQKAVAIAVDQVRESLMQFHPEFQFVTHRIRRPEMIAGPRVDPSQLLQQSIRDRDSRHLDFAFMVTSAELAGVYSPYCYAAVSRPLDAAVFSVALIDPRAHGGDTADESRIELIAKRLSRLILHAIGHLTGLSPSEDPVNLLYQPAMVDDLDRMEHLDSEQSARQRHSLEEIADQRLEEQSGGRVGRNWWGRVKFFTRATWINRREILEAVWGARPWEFPTRLSRLTVASVSTVAVLLMTAEAWDLGLTQSTRDVAALSMLSLVLTTMYVVNRQQLLMWRWRQPSEQIVVTSVSAVVIVLAGMLTTWVVLTILGIVGTWMLHRPVLISGWAAAADLRPAQIGWAAKWHMSAFSASMGLLIGALGASFESQNYFRHIIFVDEEI